MYKWKLDVFALQVYHYLSLLISEQEDELILSYVRNSAVQEIYSIMYQLNQIVLVIRKLKEDMVYLNDIQ